MAAAEGQDIAGSLAAAAAFISDDAAFEALDPAIRALELSRAAGDVPARARAARLALLAHGARGDGKAAGELGRQELEVAKQAGDTLGQATLLLALAESSPEGTEQLQAWAKDALALFKELGEHGLEASSLVALSMLRLRVSRPAEAAKAASEAVDLARALGDARIEASARHAAAEVSMYEGAVDDAVCDGRRAVELLRQLGLRRAEAAQLHAVARWLLTHGRAQEAIEAVDEALDILEEVYVVADSREIAYWKTLVQAHTKANNMASALRAARNGFDRYEDAHDKSGQGNANLLISSVQSNQGLLHKAIRSANKAAHAFEDGDHQAGRGEALCVVSRIRSRLGLFDKALRDLQEALDVFEDLGDLLGQGRALHQRAEVFMGKRDTKSALRCAAESRELFQDAKNLPGEAEALLQLSAAELASGNIERSGRAAEEAKLVFADMDDMVGEASAELTLLSANMRAEQFDVAIKTGKRALALYREFGDRPADEVYTMMQLVIAQILSVVAKSQAGTATDRMLQDGVQKATGLAAEALSIADDADDARLRGFAQYALAFVLSVVGPYKEALAAVSAALSCFKECRDLQWEAGSFILKANIHIVQGEYQFSVGQGSAEEAIWMAQQMGDAVLEDEGWAMLDRVEAARRAHEERAQRARPAQAMQGQIVPAAQAAPRSAEAPEQDVSRAAPADQVARAAPVEMGNLSSPEAVAAIVTDLAKQLIGEDEELDFDRPLMEAGLTSNTAVLFRDQLSKQITGVRLPVTLSFDYPSISAISELIGSQLLPSGPG